MDIKPKLNLIPGTSLNKSNVKPATTETDAPAAGNTSSANSVDYTAKAENMRGTQPNERNNTPPPAPPVTNPAFQAFLQQLLKLFTDFFKSNYGGGSTPPSPPPAPPTPPVNASAINGVSGSDRFQTLETLVGKAGLGDAITELEKKGPITILAPTQEAFAALPDGLGAKLQKPENKEVLREILLYHVQNKPLEFKPNTAPKALDSLLSNDKDDNVVVGGQNTPTFVNNGQIVSGEAPIKSDNGSIVIPINAVLIPPGIDLSKLK